MQNRAKSRRQPSYSFSTFYGKFDSGGIRTHATEVTGALNQRLRPLGHAILSLFEKKVEAIAHMRESLFQTQQDAFCLTDCFGISSVYLDDLYRHILMLYHILRPVFAQNRPLSEVGFEPTPT